MVFVAFLLMRQLFLAGLTILLGLVVGAESGQMGIALAASSIDAVMSVYLAAMLAAIHSQLASN